MRQLSLIFSLIIYCAIIISCNNLQPKQFEFFYYPSRNVYYDVTNSQYLYSLDGGTTWDSLKTKMNGDPATLGAKQIVYSTSPSIWLENAQHRSQFNGKVININSDTTLSDKDLAAERKIKKAQVATTTKQPEKKRSFFQRLFGKKNKD